MLKRLETLRIPTEDNLSDPTWNQRMRKHLDTGYEQAFATYLDRPLLELSTEQAVAALGVGDIEVELAASLDHWALVREARSYLEETAADPTGTASRDRRPNRSIRPLEIQAPETPARRSEPEGRAPRPGQERRLRLPSSCGLPHPRHRPWPSGCHRSNFHGVGACP
jgi:hypothetical protein